MMPLCTTRRDCRAFYRRVHTLLPMLIAATFLAIAPAASAAYSLGTTGIVIWGGGFFGTYEYNYTSPATHVEDGYSETEEDSYLNGAGQFQGITDAHAGYGILRAYAYASVTSSNYGSQISNASAIFTDTFLFSDPSGDYGYAVFTFTVTGAVSIGADGEGGTLFVNNGLPFATFDTGGVYSSYPIEVRFDGPTTLAFGLGAVVGFFNWELTGTSYADFGSTAVLTGIQVYADYNLTQPLDSQWSAESGTQYPVPEPASGLLMLAVSASLLRRRV